MRPRGEVAILRLEYPAPGAWTARQRERFVRAFEAFAKRPRLRAIVLTGAALFDEADQAGPWAGEIQTVLDAVADSSTPVIAAIPGQASGSGLELALVCTYRVASPHSTFSLPGVAAARLPRAGTLLRLPQIIGAEAAADMAALGVVMDAATAHSLGLVDILEAGDVVTAAAGLVSKGQGLAHSPAGAEKTCTQADFFCARLRLRRDAAGQAAPLAVLRAMEAAAGAPRRRVASDVEQIASALARSDQAAALRYGAEGLAALRRASLDPTFDPAKTTQALRWSIMREAVHLVDEGATPGQIDRCFTDYGFSEGPFTQSDRLGLAAVFAVADADLCGGKTWIAYSATLDLMTDAGRTGGVGALGWYRQGEGAVRFDTDVEQLVRTSAMSQRLQRAPIADELVMERCLLAAIAGTAHILQACPEAAPEALDAIWATDLGFPRWKGGPLYQARQIGLRKIVEAAEGHRRLRDTLGAPPAILATSAALGYWAGSRRDMGAEVRVKSPTSAQLARQVAAAI